MHPISAEELAPLLDGRTVGNGVLYALMQEGAVLDQEELLEGVLTKIRLHAHENGLPARFVEMAYELGLSAYFCAQQAFPAVLPLLGRQQDNSAPGVQSHKPG